MTADNGLVTVPSPYSVDETLHHLSTLLEAKQVKIFATIDHSGEAAKVGLTLRPTKVLIFGNPQGGTPVMLAAPTVAIDLPLKVLVWEDEQGKVWAAYNSPEYLQRRHGIPADLAKNLAMVGGLVQRAVE